MFKKHDRKSIFFMFYLSYLYQILLHYSNISILWDTVRFFVPWSDTMSGYKNKFNILFHNKKIFKTFIILFKLHLSIWLKLFFSKKMQFFITKIAFIWTMVGKPTMVKINAISAMKKSILLEKRNWFIYLDVI